MGDLKLLPKQSVGEDRFFDFLVAEILSLAYLPNEASVTIGRSIYVIAPPRALSDRQLQTYRFDSSFIGKVG